MNMRKWLDDIKASREKKAMPILSFPSVQLLGVSVRELTSSSELQAKGMKMLADRYDTLASVSMMDLSVEAEAFGAKIRFTDSEVPTVVGSVVNDPADAEALEVPKTSAARCPVYIDTIRRARTMITDRPIFAGTIGPFSLAGRLMDVSEAMINCYDEPEMVHTVLAKVTDFLINYINEYKACGANGVIMAEPLAGMLSAELAEEFSGRFVKKIADAVQSDEFIIIYHNCGNNIRLIEDSLLATGAAAFHFGNAVPLRDMLEGAPSDTVIMGNVDPAGCIKDGSPEYVKSETKRILTECSAYPNFVISSGCDIPPSTDLANIDAFFGAVDEFYKAE